jgi:hypothetical protein
MGGIPMRVRYTKTAEEDVKRRDFTINGLLLLDPARQSAVQGKSRSFDSGRRGAPLRMTNQWE